MAHNYYLQPWKWITDATGSYWALPDAEGCIDFRSNTQAAIAGGTPQGYAFVSYANPITDPNAVSLGTTLGTIPNATRVLIRTTLGITGQLTSTTLLGILNELFASHSDPTGTNGFKPNMPNHLGLLELYLGGHSRISSEKMIPGKRPAWPLIKDTLGENYRKIRSQAVDIDSPVPEDQHKKYLDALQDKYRVDYVDFIPVDLPDEGTVPHDTVVKDNFNRADSTTLGTSSDSQFTWLELINDADIVSNTAEYQNTLSPNGSFGRFIAALDLSSDDHFAQAKMINVAAGFVTTHGCLIRKDSSATETLYFGEYLSAVTPLLRILKTIAGTVTVLGSDGFSASENEVIKIQVDGSNLELFIDGVSKVTATDTAITGNLRTGMSFFNNNVAAKPGLDDFEAADLFDFPPNAPVITKVVAGNTQVTVSITGDAGKTHEVFFFTPGSTVPVSGGTRVGDGDIIITGLTNGVTITIIALTQSVSGTLFGPPSNCVSATPAATAATPSRPIAAVYNKTFTELVSSTGLGAWIASVNALETTAGHVFLGYDPNKIKDVITKGPAAFVHLGRFETGESISEKAFNAEQDVKVTFVWAINQHTQENLVDEVNRLEAILLEFSALGLNPGGTSFPGNLKRMSAPSLIMIESEKPVIRQAEVTFTFAFPMEN